MRIPLTILAMLAASVGALLLLDLSLLVAGYVALVLTRIV